MRIIARLTVAGSLALAVGACSSETPTGTTVTPSGPRQSSGVTFGSGNAVGGGYTYGSGNAMDGTATTAAVAADTGSTATGRGVTFGSGN